MRPLSSRVNRKEVHRGSLFSNQELALASFLEIDVIAAREEGVKREDGILQFLQVNPISFKDRGVLASKIMELVRKRGWSPSWRNEVVLESTSSTDNVRVVTAGNRLAKYFHINVRNRHRDKLATNCYAYLEKAVRLRPKTDISLKTVEFKWAGTWIPSVGIAPGGARAFDAFLIFHDSPTELSFSALSDSSEFVPIVEGQGNYELSYVIIADNFPPARASFRLTLNRSLDKTTFRSA